VTLGIVGAGKLGTALAKAAVDAGIAVTLTSRDVEGTRLIAEVMVPGASVGTLDDVAHADIVVLALPLHRLRDLPPGAFNGNIVVDAINWWEPVDGPMSRFGVGAAETSRLVRELFRGARVVKALNQLGYHDIEDGRRPAGSAERLGVAVAGDDPQAVITVSTLVDTLGFDPVAVGTLDEGQTLGPGGPAFGVAMTAPELKRALSLEPTA
jgi:predicted dinucleotide-binding enzyme